MQDVIKFCCICTRCSTRKINSQKNWYVTFKNNFFGGLFQVSVVPNVVKLGKKNCGSICEKTFKKSVLLWLTDNLS